MMIMMMMMMMMMMMITPVVSRRAVVVLRAMLCMDADSVMPNAAVEICKLCLSPSPSPNQLPSREEKCEKLVWGHPRSWSRTRT
jgi:hypothetical protein